MSLCLALSLSVFLSHSFSLYIDSLLAFGVQDKTRRSGPAGSAVSGLFAGGWALFAFPVVDDGPALALDHPEQSSRSTGVVKLKYLLFSISPNLFLQDEEY